MDPLTDRLLRLFYAHHGWRYCLLLAQEADGRVGWVKRPDDFELSLRLTTLGYREPDKAFLAELEALVVETEAECSTASTAWATGPAEPSPAASDGRRRIDALMPVLQELLD